MAEKKVGKKNYDAASGTTLRTSKCFQRSKQKLSIFFVFKGIFQPFELGCLTRLIRSAVKFWKAGN
jgi:hypothetical protein